MAGNVTLMGGMNVDGKIDGVTVIAGEGKYCTLSYLTVLCVLR